MLVMRGVTEFFDHSSVSAGNGINLFISKSPTKPKTQHVSGIILLISSAQNETVPAKESSNVPREFAKVSFVHTGLSSMNKMARFLEQ
jgi:hypothetical protein